MRGVLAIFAAAFSLFSVPSIAFEKNPLLPDPVLTPGAVRSVDRAEICRPGYSKSVRNTSRETKEEIYRKYGVVKDHRRYKIDHLVPLSIGGADSAENLWPSPLFGGFNGRDKDRLELQLYRLVCHEGHDVRQAQNDIRTDWTAAYKKHCFAPGSCPSFMEYLERKKKPSP